jgi:N-acetylmuramoyl-L-alanine amidase
MLETLSVRLLDADGEPLADEPYVLEIDGQHTEGRTDSDGLVEISIAPDARHGTLRLTERRQTHQLELGHIDPIESISGVQARLNNLGFDCGEVDGRLGPQTAAALRQFQSASDLEATGTLDDDTRQALQDSHGS